MTRSVVGRQDLVQGYVLGPANRARPPLGDLLPERLVKAFTPNLRLSAGGIELALLWP